MTVDASSPNRLRHDGVEYGFCCGHCLERFRENPGAFLAARAPEPTQPAGAASEGRIYTCPMHPEVRQAGPGTCPKCGMALEPLDVSVGDEENHELRDMTRRLWFAASLTALVVAVAMGHLTPGDPLSRLLSMRGRVLLEPGARGAPYGRRRRNSSTAPTTAARERLG